MNDSGIENKSVDICEDCGAVVAEGKAGCLQLFEEILVKEFSDYRYGKIHRLTADAYSLQHPDAYMRSGKSFAAHLTGIYAALEAKDALAVNPKVRKWLDANPKIEKPAGLPRHSRRLGMNTDELIKMVHANFSRIYLGGIPSLLNDSGGAFLSFICTLTATEALGGFLRPKDTNGPRFKSFVEDYFPAPLNAQSDTLWKFRNAAVHGFSPGPYKVTHHNSHLHLTTDQGLMVLNAEDFYAALVTGAKKYFDAVQSGASLRFAFEERAKDPDTGVLFVGPLTGNP